VRKAEEIGHPDLSLPDPPMLEIAKKIIDQQKGEFDSTQFVDRYEEALRVLIEEKKASRSPAGGLRWVRTSICRPAGRLGRPCQSLSLPILPRSCLRSWQSS
jgi:hypothetical protein